MKRFFTIFPLNPPTLLPSQNLNFYSLPQKLLIPNHYDQLHYEIMYANIRACKSIQDMKATWSETEISLPTIFAFRKLKSTLPGLFIALVVASESVLKMD
jgi:hypothetical protein